MFPLFKIFQIDSWRAIIAHLRMSSVIGSPDVEDLAAVTRSSLDEITLKRLYRTIEKKKIRA